MDSATGVSGGHPFYQPFNFEHERKWKPRRSVVERNAHAVLSDWRRYCRSVQFWCAGAWLDAAVAVPGVYLYFDDDHHHDILGSEHSGLPHGWVDNDHRSGLAG